MMSTGYFRVYF